MVLFPYMAHVFTLTHLYGACMVHIWCMYLRYHSHIWHMSKWKYTCISHTWPIYGTCQHINTHIWHIYYAHMMYANIQNHTYMRFIQHIYVAYVTPVCRIYAVNFTCMRHTFIDPKWHICWDDIYVTYMLHIPRIYGAYRTFFHGQ